MSLPQAPLDSRAAPDATRTAPPVLENVQYLARAQYGDPPMPVAPLNAGGPIATLEESVRRQWQRYAAGRPLDVDPTFSAAPQSEYFGSVILPNGQRLHRSAGFNVFRIFRDHITGQPFTMSCHEFTFHVSTPDDPHRIWDLELSYPSDDRLSAAMATLPTIDGQAPLSYPVHATKQAPPMLPLHHRVATSQGQFEVATADAVMREPQTSVSPEELVEDPESLLRGRARSPFSAIIMGPHGARFEATMARDIYQRARESLRLSGGELFSSDSENDSLPDLVSLADSSLDSESADIDLGICQLCFEIHSPAPWDCPLFGTAESPEATRSRESGTAVGSDTSAEKIGEGSIQDEGEWVTARCFQDSTIKTQKAEEVRKAFKDFTIAFDAPEGENEKEFRSVVDMLEHEAADGLRALAARLRVEHAAVDELREIEEGLRRLETEEREAEEPIRADSPYPRLIHETRGYARARAQRPAAILQRGQRPPVVLHFNPRSGDVITRDTWSSSASASPESSSSEPLTPYDNDDHDAYRADNEYLTAEELEIRNFYESISPGDWSPAISDWSVEEFDLFPPFRPNPAHIIDLAICRALGEQYRPCSRSSSDPGYDNSREDAEAAAEFPQPDFSPRLGAGDQRSEQIRLELQSWTYECNAHRLTHLQHEDEMGSEPANAALRALHGPLSKFVDYIAMAAEGVTNLHHPPSPPPYAVSLFVGTPTEDPHGNSSPTSLDFSLPMVTRLPMSVERSTQVGREDEGEGSEMRPRVGTKRKLTDGEAAEEGDREGKKKRKNPKTTVKATGLTDDNVVRLMAGVRLALLETGSRLEDMVWHRYGVTDCFFPSRYLHHPLLFDLEVAKLQTIWSILQRNGRVHLADKLHELLSIRLRNEYVVSHVLNAGYLDFNYPEGETNYWDLLEDPDNVSTHHRTFSEDQVHEYSPEAGKRLSEGDGISENGSYGGLQYPATEDESSDEECHHHGPDRCRRCGKRLAVSCPTLTDPGTNALGLTL
ncbi:hypothetical protein DFH08DRAFT_977275 [Mycena albidolilacea]|uniref:Uncharacterized protein n=1 Tax=Mycena albidolilacea TaxID=1033008 RepID=A0AAD7E9C4_9AGAR|nr:hypothetical protein DFH08DRAFT_977275 [Mycena albidolilacea]